MSQIDDDAEFYLSRIAKVDVSDAGWVLTFDDGWSLYCTNAECVEAPEAGEFATLYGRGLGFAVRGIRIGKRVYRYQTNAQHDEELRQHLAESDKRRAVETAEMLVREAARTDAGEKYAWRDGMGEISGFGGGYEEACRQMLRAGLRWLDEHKDAAPKFHGHKGIFGVISEDNEDAAALSKAVMVAVGDDCTGAMHQAVIGACLYVKAHGWDGYCKAMTR